MASFTKSLVGASLGVALVGVLTLPLALAFGALVIDHHDHDPLDHHDRGRVAHHETEHDAICAQRASDLLHGHEHDESVPEHDHGLTSTPVAPKGPSIAFRFEPTISVGRLVHGQDGARAVDPASRDRSRRTTDPPLLDLLCTLRV